MLTHGNYLEQCKALTAWYPFWPGVRYLSILPTNHAIDFMVGFIGPFVCGACVVHLRTLRPGVRSRRFCSLPHHLRHARAHDYQESRAWRSRKPRRTAGMETVSARSCHFNQQIFYAQTTEREAQPQSHAGIHKAFGGDLIALITGGAFMEPATLQFFYDLGIPVANGYGLTEACTVLTVNDLKPFRADTVGKPLPGVELRILKPDADGIGEVAAKSATIMSHYLDDPELTAETIVDGWLLTGDLGRFDLSGHLQLFGRKKNMIVTEGGKNIYPEDIESAFEGIEIKEHCIFAANYLWPKKELIGEKLVLVLHPDLNQEVTQSLLDQIAARNRGLPDFKRIGGYLVWDKDFPRTASMKIKRNELADQIRTTSDRSSVKEI